MRTLVNRSANLTSFRCGKCGVSARRANSESFNSSLTISPDFLRMRGGGGCNVYSEAMVVLVVVMAGYLGWALDGARGAFGAEAAMGKGSGSASGSASGGLTTISVAV